MPSKRLTRVNELLHREIAASLYKVMRMDEFDLAAVTITHVLTSADLRKARVLVSIRGDEATADRHMTLLRRNRTAIQREVNGRVVLKFSPLFHFVRDDSVAQGDHVLNLLKGLDVPDDEPQA